MMIYISFATTPISYIPIDHHLLEIFFSRPFFWAMTKSHSNGTLTDIYIHNRSITYNIGVGEKYIYTVMLSLFVRNLRSGQSCETSK